MLLPVETLEKSLACHKHTRIITDDREYGLVYLSLMLNA